MSSKASEMSLLGSSLDVTSNTIDISTKTGSLNIPKGTTAQRPSSPSNGMIRYNTDVGGMEYYSAARTQWVGVELFQAAGGAVSTYSSGGVNYKVHAFTASDTFTVLTGSGTIEVLIVAGGGGTGFDVGGGGGAGGLIYQSTLAVSTNTYSIVIGAGGGSGQTSAVKGTSGGNTTAFGYTAIGGGGGGAYPDNGSGLSGGSGGGGGDNGWSGGSGTSGQGYAGGTSNSASWGSAGGGGAGGAGADGVQGAQVAGGAPYYSSISGTSVAYAGGGYGNSDGGTVHPTGYNAAGAQIGYYGFGANGTGSPNNSPYSGNGGIVIIRYAI